MMYFSGVLMLLLGIGILLSVVRGLAANGFWAGWFGVLFFLMGISILIFSYGYQKIFWKDYTALSFLAGMGMLFYSVFVMDVWKLISCKQKVMAECTGCRTNYNHRSPDTYTPLFSYEWEGQAYHNISSGLSISKRKIMKYHSGEQYQIYINSNNPMVIRVSRRLSGADVLVFIIGTAFFITFFSNI